MSFEKFVLDIKRYCYEKGPNKLKSKCIVFTRDESAEKLRG